MISDYQWRIVDRITMYPAPQLRYRLVCLKQCLSCKPPHRKNNSWLNRPDLFMQKRRALPYFIAKRVSIIGRPALQHVTDKYGVSRQIQTE